MFKVYRYRVGFWSHAGQWFQADFDRETTAELYATHLERCGVGVAVNKIEVHTPTKPVERAGCDGLR